jgi:hypothetical protein
VQPLQGWGDRCVLPDGEHDAQALARRVGHQCRRHPVQVVDVIEPEDRARRGEGTEGAPHGTQRPGRDGGRHLAGQEPGEGTQRDGSGRGRGGHADDVDIGLGLQGAQHAGPPHPRCPRQQHTRAVIERTPDVVQHTGPSHQCRHHLDPRSLQ